MKISQQHRGHYATPKTKQTPKMSTSSNNKQNRCRFSRTTLLPAIFACLLLNLPILQIQGMSADYGDTEELQLNSGSNSEVVSKTDEVYDTAQLQQEVEEENRHDMALSSEDTETQTATPLKMNAHNMSTNQISAGEYSQEKVGVNATRRNSSPIDSSEEMSDEYIDSEHGAAKNAATTTTTMIPDYVVRKAKAKTFKANDDRSMSDYEDEVDGDGDIGMASGESENTRRLFIQHQADQIVPLARKFYQPDDGKDDDDEDIATAGNINDLLKRPHHPLIPMPQQQFQLPEQHLDQNFHNHSDEEYYEDSRDESYEHLVTKQHLLTTTTPLASIPTSTATTTTTTITPTVPTFIPNFIGSRSGFPLSVDAWTRTSTTTTTSMPITTTIIYNDAAIYLNNPTTTTTIATTRATTASTTTTTTTTAPTTTTTTTKVAPPPTTSRPAPTASPTTTAPTSNKQGKQIHISRRKLLPYEQLRNYIEDAYIRMPLAVIVDPSTESLEKTKALWRDALRTDYNIKIVLVALNASGIPAAFSFNNTRQFLAGLNSIKENNGGNAFIGIVHASELVPFDSAVFISTAAIPPHTELVQDAAITLLKKRIRLYVLWFGERSITENETQEGVGGILGEVAIRSGGETLNIVGSENSQELEGNTLTLVADAYRGSQEVDVPVDTTMSSLHVKIDSPMRSATLETPNGG